MTAATVNPQFSYHQHEVPTDYLCARCKVQGVRLYRDYGGCPPGDLLCTRCTERDQNRRVDTAQPYEIAWRVLAVPCEDGTGYWGYTSIPMVGVNWWERLPVDSP